MMEHAQAYLGARDPSALGTPRRLLLLVFLALVGSSCATMPSRQATRTDIVDRSKRVIAKRETWAGAPYCVAVQDKFDGTWRVEAHAIDPAHTDCGCVLFVLGTWRELLFTPSGRLISYVSPK